MKRIFLWTAIVVGLLVVGVLALPLFIDANQFRPELEARISAAMGRQVTIGDLSVALFSGGVAVRDVVVAGEPGGLEPLLRAKSITAGVDMRELILSRRLVVRSIHIDEPEIFIVDSATPAPKPAATPEPAAPAESSTGAPTGAPLDISVQAIQISDGRVSVTTNSGAKPVQLDGVNLALSNVAANSSFPVSLTAHLASGGDIKIEGQAGPFRPQSLSETPFDAKVTISDLDLAASGLFDPETGIAGLLSLDGNATADGSGVQTAGKLSVKDLKLAKNGKPATKPAEVDFKIAHDYRTRKGKIEDSKVRLGAAQASVAGTYDLSGREPFINMKLSGAKMPMTELASFLQALNVELPAGSKLESGTADVNVTAQGAVSKWNTAASLRADKVRLAGFDLGSKMKVLAQLAGLPSDAATNVELLTTDVRTAPEGSTVDALKLVVPGIGELTGQGTISPEHALNMRMVAKLETTGQVRQVLGQTVPFLIQGTAADPSFKADLKSVANQKLQQAIKNPEGAAKTVTGIINMFKRAPKTEEKK